MVDLTRKFDVLVIGGGNAALCAAISARRAGASVLVLEGAPKFYRGGKTRHTRHRYPHRPLYRAGILGRSVAPHRRPDRRGTGAAHDCRIQGYSGLDRRTGRALATVARRHAEPRP